ncbi:MAG: hypothetical protein HYU53_14380 [Acidobacteria bacterium]|nr:hypothetical protein [Acidobacteriota bacterium]
MRRTVLACALLALAAPAFPQNASSDEYTRYELLDPPTAKFRVVYDVTAVDGSTIVFARPLGINRNAVVLPAGYEVVSCNVPNKGDSHTFRGLGLGKV